MDSFKSCVFYNIMVDNLM